jgi:hypothetical protein
VTIGSGRRFRIEAERRYRATHGLCGICGHRVQFPYSLESDRAPKHSDDLIDAEGDHRVKPAELTPEQAADLRREYSKRRRE